MQAESFLPLLMVNGVRKGLPDIYPLFKTYMFIRGNIGVLKSKHICFKMDTCRYPNG